MQVRNFSCVIKGGEQQALLHHSQKMTANRLLNELLKFDEPRANEKLVH